MSNCIFCKIVAHEIETKLVYENDKVICFNDINPFAPVHVLIVTKKHYTNLLDLSSDTENCADTMKAVTDAVSVIATLTGTDKSGFRLICNSGYNGGQSVRHLHFHFLGGSKLREHVN